MQGKVRLIAVLEAVIFCVYVKKKKEREERKSEKGLKRGKGKCRLLIRRFNVCGPGNDLLYGKGNGA